MKEYPDFLQTLEIQAREKGMDPGEVTQKFIVRWEAQTKALRCLPHNSA
jgi:hypothetical protein